MFRRHAWLIGGMLLWLLGASAVSARSLAVAPADLLPAELVGVQALPETGMAILLLRTPDGAAELPMFTGIVEAAAIDRALRHEKPSRPLTHELLGDVLLATDRRMQRLVIDELRDGQFLAALELRAKDGGHVRLVDTRPSDGLALALRYGAPVFVARQVFEAAEQEEGGADQPPPTIST